MRTEYTNARLIDAGGERLGSLFVEDGFIHAPFTPDRREDVGGRVLMPAFIDLHCHLRDPGYPDKETMESGMRAALAGGYATLCAMANTNPVIETPAQVEENLHKAQALNLCRLCQAAAAGKGLKDEIPTDYAALCKVTPLISNDGNTIFSDAFMRQLLLASRQYGFLISTHCQPERATVKRDIALLAEVGGRLHVGHISHAETAGLLREAKARGLSLSCEVTPHHVIGYDSDYRVNPPLRSKADAQALIQAICDGTVDCLCTDHAPHTQADKQNGAAGISNIEYAAQVFLRVFYENGLPLTRFAEMTSYAPAKLLGCHAGLLQAGYPADLVILDVESPSVIRQAGMRSKSHNTPFDGYPVRGRVLKTIVGGNCRYEYLS